MLAVHSREHHETRLLRCGRTPLGEHVYDTSRVYKVSHTHTIVYVVCGFPSFVRARWDRSLSRYILGAFVTPAQSAKIGLPEVSNELVSVRFGASRQG